MHSMVEFVILSLAAVTSDGGYHKPTADEEKVIRQYLDAAKALDLKYSRVKGVGVLTAPRPGPRGPGGELEIEPGTRFTFSRDGSNVLLIGKRSDAVEGDAVWRERVIGSNPSYSFFLFKNPPGSKLPYNIKALGKDKTGKVALSVKRFCFDFVDTVRGTFCGDSSAVFSRPEMRVKSIESVDYEGKACYKIEYRHAPSPENTLYETGWVIVSPSEGWVMKEYLCQSGEVGYPSIHGKVTYGPARPGEAPDPVEVAQSFGDRLGRFRIESLAFEPLDRSNFSLPKYGFSEDLAGGRRRAAHYGLPWLALGGCFLVSSITLRRALRGSRRNPVPAAGG